MAVLTKRLHAAPNEIADLRSAMRDVQDVVAQYYDACGGFAEADDLARHVRAAIAFIQKLNDVLKSHFAGSAAYKSLFEPPLDPGAEVVEAFRYIRNVGQHLPHPVRVDDGATFGGLGLGYRSYATWQDVPLSVDAQLRAGTRAARPYFEAHLRDQEVTQTLLDALRFFWRVCPDLADRDTKGEWIGFPLRSQPGMRHRLHPEEPTDEADALIWMRERKPGGDFRVICGITSDADGDEDTVFGVTFRGSCSFTPFFETRTQVERDIALGYPYHVADLAAHTDVRNDIEDRFGSFAPAICSGEPISQWVGASLTSVPSDVDWLAYGDYEFWQQARFQEGNQLGQAFITQRSRRLCAWFPVY